MALRSIADWGRDLGPTAIHMKRGRRVAWVVFEHSQPCQRPSVRLESVLYVEDAVFLMPSLGLSGCGTSSGTATQRAFSEISTLLLL